MTLLLGAPGRHQKTAFRRSEMFSTNSNRARLREEHFAQTPGGQSATRR
jgi:hypothetical protein